MLAPFIKGTLYPLRAMNLLLQPGVRRFVMLPLGINFIVFSLFFTFGLFSFSAWIDTLSPSIPEWLQWIEWLLWPLFVVALLVLGFFLSLLLASLIATPFNDMLATAVEQHLGALPPRDDAWLDALRDIVPTLLHELRKLAYIALLAIPCLLLFVIPVVNVLAPPLWLLFGSWMLALEYLDIPMGNHRLHFAALHRHMKQQRALCLGLGVSLMLLTVVPVLNFFTMPIAVAAATQLFVENYKDTLNKA